MLKKFIGLLLQVAIMTYEAVVIGTSAGGLAALSAILPSLPEDFPLPILIVQHMAPNKESYLSAHLDQLSRIRVKEADDKEPIEPGRVYLAPGGYHLLIENDHSLSLSSDDRVCYSRPSIDVLFECAADVFREHLIGIVLTGANNDGASGLAQIKACGGLAIVQDPQTAEAMTMPEEAIKAAEVDYVLSIKEIAPLLCKIVQEQVNQQVRCGNEKR
jgi:two-component system, chemotaxis family, protein-glutamate methylesterase/glutaminase